MKIGHTSALPRGEGHAGCDEIEFAEGPVSQALRAWGLEEGLVLREPRLLERARPAAEVILQFLRVHGVDRLPSPDVALSVSR